MIFIQTLFLILINLHAYSQQTRLALLIAESKYDSATGWVQLHTYNDVEVVRKALVFQGFADSNILTIIDHEATKDKIVKAFSKQLTEKSKPGDIAFFYYSGHGQRIQDKNGDELDGFDESFVPVDAPQHYQRGVYEGEKHLTDDEFNNLLIPLRKKLGPEGSVVVAVDACFSGTITRSMSMPVFKGTSILMASPDYHPDRKDGGEKSKSGFVPGTVPGKRQELSSLIVFSACRDYESAFELPDTSNGAFTAAFAKSLMKFTNGISYTQLSDLIRVEMTGDIRQNPNIDGDINLSVFGNNTLKTLLSHKILKKINDSTLLINAGTFAGLYPGSTLEFSKGSLNTDNKYDVLSKGTVIKSEPFKARVLLDTKLPVIPVSQILVVPKDIKPGDSVTSLLIKIQNPVFNKAIHDALTQKNIVRISGNYTDLFVIDSLINEYLHYWLNTSKGVCLLHDSLLVQQSETAYNSAAGQIMLTIFEYLQATNLIKTSVSSRELQPVLQLVPVSQIKTDPYLHNPRSEFSVGELFCFRFMIKGPANRDAFYSLINVSNGAKIAVQWPSEKRSAIECRCRLNEFVTLSDTFSFTDPGNEIFLLICSDEPVDLRPQLENSQYLQASRGTDMMSFNPLSGILTNQKKRAFNDPKTSIINLSVLVR